MIDRWIGAIVDSIISGISPALNIRHEETLRIIHDRYLGLSRENGQILTAVNALSEKFRALELELSDKRRHSKTRLPDFENDEARALAGIDAVD